MKLGLLLTIAGISIGIFGVIKITKERRTTSMSFFAAFATIAASYLDFAVAIAVMGGFIIYAIEQKK
jgi:hypothetical protein